MVTKFLPLPPDNGGKYRSLAVLTRLAQRGQVVLCAFDDGRADRSALEAMGVEVRAVRWHPTTLGALRATMRVGSLTAGRFFSKELADEISAATTEAPTELLVVGYAQLSPYGRVARAEKRVLDLHNVESDLTASYARLHGSLRGLPFAAEAAALRRFERRALREYDLVLVTGRRDHEMLPGPHPHVLECPNGWDPGRALPPANEPVAAFVALLGWGPNVDGAVWLAREVWPLVCRRHSGARLLLVGRDPTLAVQALQGDTVEVTGHVPDVRPYLAAARVGLAPLRAGGGSRLKILEALDAGRPVVATTLGAQGLEDLIGEGVVTADTPEAMANAIAELLCDGERAAELGRRGHQAVQERYAWDKTLAPFLDWVDA